MTGGWAGEVRGSSGYSFLRDKGLGQEKEGSKEKVADEGIAEKKIGWWKTGVSNGQGLDPASEGLGIERNSERDGRVEIPIDGIGYEIEKERRKGRRGEDQEAAMGGVPADRVAN